MPEDERSKFMPDAHAGQSSSNSGPAGASAGTMAVDYEGKGDPFLGPEAHVVSGEPANAPNVEDDPRGGPAMNIDVGKNPHGGVEGGDDLVHSDGFADDHSVRSPDNSRKDA